MAFTRVVFEVNDCDDLDTAVERIRAGFEEPVDFAVEDDD